LKAAPLFLLLIVGVQAYESYRAKTQFGRNVGNIARRFKRRQTRPMCVAIQNDEAERTKPEKATCFCSDPQPRPNKRVDDDVESKLLQDREMRAACPERNPPTCECREGFRLVRRPRRRRHSGKNLICPSTNQKPHCPRPSKQQLQEHGKGLRSEINEMRNKFGLGGRRKFRMRKQMNRGAGGGSNNPGAQSVWDRRARRLDVWAQAFGGAPADGGQGNENNNNQQDKNNKNNGMLDLRSKFREGVGGIKEAFRSGLAQQCTCPNGETPVTATAPERDRDTDDYDYDYDGYEEEEEGEELEEGAGVAFVMGGGDPWSGF